MNRTIVLVISLQILELVMADFEQTCVYSDYMEANAPSTHLSRCGTMLTELVIFRCRGQPYLGRDSGFVGRKKRDISLSGEEANSYLTRRRRKRSFNTGIVCECCIHTCSMAELDQYCAPPTRRRRSVRDVITNTEPSVTAVAAEPQITEEDVKLVYSMIDAGAESLRDVITVQDLQRMEYIERIKRNNIERKYAKLLGIEDADTLTITSPAMTADRMDRSEPPPLLKEDAASLLANSLVDASPKRRHRHHNQKKSRRHGA